MRIRSALLPLLLLFLGFSACNGESEGQPCLVDSDCSSGLTCVKPPNTSTDGLRCCPSATGGGTTPECTALSAVAFDASSAVPDGGYDTGAPTPDAAPEGAADTGASVDSSDATAPADAADATLPPADASDGAPATDGSGE
jgi:hypothetical protein